MKQILGSVAMQDLIKGTLKDKAELFTASILEVWGADNYLQKCDPAAVAKECLKAATLNLPLSKALGFAWVVPFNVKQKDPTTGKESWVPMPQFQIGWKGYVQLAQRTGQYRFINAGPVYEGELRKVSKLTGEIDIEGDAVSEKVVGFFAHIELTNGYSKSLYWSIEKMQAHAIKYNQQCKKVQKLAGIWASDFEAMGTKTVLSTLIRRYGIMSTEMLGVIREDENAEDRAKAEIDANANAETVGFEDVTAQATLPENVNPETGEVMEPAQVDDDGPGF
ncbi:MAG: recombinase [Desulfobulbaceae bacterium]|nr:recombinase [Desulfobulbaceae bacterium]